MSVSTNSGIVTFTIKTNGIAVPDEFRVLSVEVTKQVNGIAKAIITVLDGDPDTQTFDTSSSNTYVPGNMITVEAGYDSKNTLLFSGIITGQNLKIDQTIGSALVVECHDLCIKTTVARNSKTWFNVSDGKIIESIMQNYSGINLSVASPTLTVQQRVQNSVSDWEFIQSLAAANGMIVSAVNNRLTVALPDAQTSPVATATYGNDLLEFNADLNAIHQLAAVEVSSWNFPTQIIQSTVVGNSYAGPGNLSSSILSQVVGLSEYPLETTTILSAAERSANAKAVLTKTNYAKITGKAKIQGTAIIEPASYIELAGLGTRFSGNHFVSGIDHLLSDGNWTSEVSIGLAPVQKTESQLSETTALSGIKGLYNATVKQMHDDPNNQFSILVTIPVLDPSGTGIWARISQFYASSNAGAFFLPEVGDEVIVGFLNDDSGSPVILGSVYSSPQHQPDSSLQPQERNPLKAIVSRSGIALMFDDDNKILSLKTPSNNSIVMSDKDKMITIQDQNGNVFSLSNSGISMKSPKSISIQSDQILSLEGTQGIQLKSSGGDISLQGMNIEQTADMTYSVDASMSMNLQSGTEMKLRSSMIFIN
ncbi:MAG: type VI secretion system tip protein VgrG [Bacteroidota bacterium]